MNHTIFYLPILSLFYDSSNSLDYIASNNKMISGQWRENDEEGRVVC